MVRIFFFLIVLLGGSLVTDAQMPISKARMQSEGTYVTVQGIVLNGSELGPIRFIQGPTGGIALYPGNGSIPGLQDLQPGDEVLVSGYIEDFQDLTEISPILELEVLNNNQELPAARLIDTDEMEDYFEGRQVRLQCVNFTQSGNFVGGTLYTLQHHTGDGFSLYLGNGHPLTGTPIPNGPIDITGILSDFNGHQLVIRSTQDWTVSPCFYLTESARPDEIQPTSVSMTWSTNQTGEHFLLYGPTPALGSSSDTLSNTTDIDLLLSGLAPATHYYVQPVSIRDGYRVEPPRQIISTSSAQNGDVRVFFTQSVDTDFSTGVEPEASPGAALQMVLDAIDDAELTVDVAALNNNLSSIRGALNAAVARGVRVRYIFDDWPANTALNGSVDFPVLVGNPGDYLMHHKFLIIDAEDPEALVVLSSTNLTSSGFSSDYNNLLRIQDQALAKALTVEFNEMWGSGGPQPDEAASLFGPAKDRENTPRYFSIDGHPAELFFTPDRRALDRLETLLGTAQEKIAVGMYVFTLDPLAEALRDQTDNGLDVRGIIEDYDGPGAEYYFLLGQGVSVQTHPPSPLFHHKYAVWDAWTPGSGTVVTGSYNWTNAATRVNDELILIWEHPEVANQFVQEFEARWQEAVSVEERGKVSVSISSFPNPGGFDRNLVIPAGAGTLTVDLVNSTGQTCWEGVFPLIGTTQTVPIQLPAFLAPGIYFLHWNTPTQTGVESWIIHSR
jgi:phosphatidylserine/phosphatidylglycerophosphate/cardiolipin synthase-like enzyme